MTDKQIKEANRMIERARKNLGAVTALLGRIAVELEHARKLMEEQAMTDIVERLRQREIENDANGITPLGHGLEADARAEIERLRAALSHVCDAQREAVAIVNKQGAAFPGSLAVACEKARTVLRDGK